MLLRHIIWAWDAALAILATEDAATAGLVGESCWPLATDLRRVGVLDVVLGSWRAEARQALEHPRRHALVELALGKALDEKVAVLVVPWPGVPESPGMAPPALLPADTPPSLLAEAGKCEAPLERFFLAAAARRKLSLVTQHPVGTFRIDFALPRRMVGAEIQGWFRRRERAFAERSEELKSLGWRVVTFAGQDVYENVDAAVQALAREVGK
ncbi:MAG: DUF559 domain-containing protein [Chloroflexi bacterium]|nr:DUF559 domain-containing protein [Chloroflexota bacterium]